MVLYTEWISNPNGDRSKPKYREVRTFGHKGGQERVLTLSHAEFHTLYSSPNITTIMECKSMKWARHLRHQKYTRKASKILVREDMRPLRKI
jgi:hypothetical protein